MNGDPRNPPSDDPDGDTRTDVAHGVGIAFLGRAGAVVEAVSVPVFTWLFGLATYGLFIALWSYQRLVSALADFGMSTALQRYGSGARSDADAHAVLRLALIVSTSLAVLIALLTSLLAPLLALVLNVAAHDRAALPGIITLYAWVLPLWTLVDVATAAIRARRRFGPEIRVRIFYEQGSRLLFALGFFALGFQSYGLFLAHMASLGFAAVLSVHLLLKNYDWRLLLGAPLPPELRREVLGFVFALVPANLIKRLFSDLPPLLLNVMLPAAAGARAAGLYGVARKIASVLQIVRLSFEYVLAPLAAAKAHLDWAQVNVMYGFATRVASLMILPLAAAVIVMRKDISALFGPEAAAAAPLIAILTLGRCGETLTGPSAAILEMIGLRRLPVLVNLAGISLSALLALLLVPRRGAIGMAVAMAAGLNLVAWSSVLLLRWRHHLSPFGPAHRRAVGVGLLGAGLLAFAAIFLRGPHQVAAMFVMLAALYIPLARLGLSADDRRALKLKKRSKSLDAPGIGFADDAGAP